MAYPMPTAVLTRSGVTPDDVKLYCKIDTAFTEQDDEIKEMLDAVKIDHDKTLWNYFTDDDLPTGNEIPIPSDVKLSIKRRFARLFEWRVERQDRETLEKVGSASVKQASENQSADVDDFEPILYLRDPLNLIGF